MLEKLIDLSIRNKFMIALLTVFRHYRRGSTACLKTPIDAIPDLSDVQVIIFTEYPGQAPQVVEDQVTYPLTTQMLAVPGAKVVRGYSFFGYSFVYIIFEEGTDIYWARSRVLEYLNYASGKLPKGVTPTLGPDATGVGWVYEYALVSDGRTDLQQLRSIQDWFLRYELTAVEGVSEVASIGGYRQAVPGERRSGAAARLPLHHPPDQGGDPAQQQRCRRAAHRDGRDRIHDPRQGLHPVEGGYRKNRSRHRQQRDAGAGARSWPK